MARISLIHCRTYPVEFGSLSVSGINPVWFGVTEGLAVVVGQKRPVQVFSGHVVVRHGM